MRHSKTWARAPPTPKFKLSFRATCCSIFDKSDLRPVAIPSLLKVVTVMQSYPAYLCTIGGHTDGKGGKDYNRKLSERRANSVKTWLVGHGASNQMNTQGFGDTKPVAPNMKPDGSDNPDGRQKNRRVEITLKKH